VSSRARLEALGVSDHLPVDDIGQAAFERPERSAPATDRRHREREASMGAVPFHGATCARLVNRPMSPMSPSRARNSPVGGVGRFSTQPSVQQALGPVHLTIRSDVDQSDQQVGDGGGGAGDHLLGWSFRAGGMQHDGERDR
jgi:hypothetical protein